MSDGRWRATLVLEMFHGPFGRNSVFRCVGNDCIDRLLSNTTICWIGVWDIKVNVGRVEIVHNDGIGGALLKT